MPLKCRRRQDEHLLLLLLDPAQQLVDGGDDGQLGGGGAEGGVQLEGLGEPAQHHLVPAAVVHQLQRLRRRQKPVLDGEVDTAQPPPGLGEVVARRVHRGGELGRGAGLVEEVPHVGELHAGGGVVDTLQSCRDAGHYSVSLCNSEHFGKI